MTLFDAASLIWKLSFGLAALLACMMALGTWLRYKKPPYNPIILLLHEIFFFFTGITILGAILIIEWIVRHFHLPIIWLFWIHLPLCLMFIKSFAQAGWFNGLKERRAPNNKKRHKKFAYRTILFGIPAAITGDIMVAMVVWPRF